VLAISLIIINFRIRLDVRFWKKEKTKFKFKLPLEDICNSYKNQDRHVSLL